jgi:hypothetical protein
MLIPLVLPDAKVTFVPIKILLLPNVLLKPALYPINVEYDEPDTLHPAYGPIKLNMMS